MIHEWLSDLISKDAFKIMNIKVIHIKTNIPYFITGVAINTTNANDNHTMIVYEDYDGKKRFVREINEFCEKFEKASEEEKEGV